MPTLYHPKTGGEFEAVNDEQADALAASGWKRKKPDAPAPAKSTAAPRKRTAAKKAAAKKAPATPKAPAADTKEN